VSANPQIPQLSFSALSVVKFPNTACNSTSTDNRIGTCYTTEECAEKDGTASGYCANGYGVCCLTSLSCGGSSKENNTYLTMTTTTNPDNLHCLYQICPLNVDICRIKLDFIVFSIASPQTGTTDTAATTSGGAFGTCYRDTFSLSSGGNLGSPIICGYNTGQHMFVDAISSCSNAAFTFNKDTVSRSYDIRVIQYECGDTQGGPPDCLQYFTGTSGEIASFNFPTNLATITSTVTHLANQHYATCWRRESGYCAVCYYPKVAIGTVAGNAAATQSSFGVSNSATVISDETQSQTDAANCEADYLTIPYATRVISQATGSSIPTYDAGSSATNDLRDRICGRIFAADEKKDALEIYGSTVSVCSFVRPFRFAVDFDNTEDVTGSDGDDTDQLDAPGGIVGFYLSWLQKSCT